jgi:thiamine biosynthesis lipoprotein
VAQGTTYSLQWHGGGSEADIAVAAELELERLDALLSNYRSDSTLERFNALRSIEPTELPTELIALLELAKTVHEASAGCFDPTIRPLVRAWGFDTDQPVVPAAAPLAAARAAVGLDKLQLLEGSRARKVLPEVEIDMASIGQGYTAARLADLLERRGSTAYLAEIGGEIVARGVKPDGMPWRIGVENPSSEGPPGPALRLIPETRTAVITSGTYRHYFEAGDRRLGHILDPRSGSPVEHSLLSVTVVGEDAAAAAAWATALLCLGPDEAAATAERERLAALLWVGNAGEPTLHVSRAPVGGWPAVIEERAPP